MLSLSLTNADPCYAAFHDEEWGVPVHDDKYADMIILIFLILITASIMQYSNALYNCRKLFELLVLSGALAELTWPAILNKRAMFRYLSAFPYVPSHS